MNWFNFGNVFFLGQVDTVIGVLVHVDTCESECLNFLGSKRKDLFKFGNLGFKVGLTPLRDRSQVVRNGINSCSSNELNARNVQPHQKPSKTKNTTPEGHVPAWHSCPGIHVLAFMSCCTLKAGAAAVNLKFLTVQIDIQQRDDQPKGSQRTAGMAGQFKRLVNGKAVCSTLLNRTINSKVSLQ